MLELIERLRSGPSEPDCRCTVTVDRPAGVAEPRLTVDADDCPGEGVLAAAPACRRRIAAALAERAACPVAVEHTGLVRTYTGRGAATLGAAGRFHDRVRDRDPQLAARALRDPVGAARAATGRAGPVASAAATTGLSACVTHEPPSEYERLFRPTVAPVGSLGRVTAADPPTTPDDEWELDTGGVVRRVERPDGFDRLHLTPASTTLGTETRRTLAAARERLATGTAADRSPDRAVATAVRAVATETTPTERLTTLLRRHTTGLGLLADLLAVPGASDLWLTAPVADTPVRVGIDGRSAETNVRLSGDDTRTLASRVRAAGGGLSRAQPTTDATLDGVRVAAVDEPVSDGPAFALRRDHATEPWTLPRLVAAGTLSARAAALLSLAVGRGGAGLVAGPRGAGKTTALGALLWAFPATVRTVVIEDTPELPVSALQRHGRDVQRLDVESDDDAFTATDAVRTALRLGEGALVVGEVRGTEATALYEAMRVGAAADAVLGTIHGTDAAGVRERVVADLGVAPSAFAATEFVVSLAPDHRLAAFEEVRSDGHDGDTRFRTLFDRDGATGVLRRGDSRLLASLAHPTESYADTLDTLAARTERVERLVAAGRTTPDARFDRP